MTKRRRWAIYGRPIIAIYCFRCDDTYFLSEPVTFLMGIQYSCPNCKSPNVVIETTSK